MLELICLGGGTEFVKDGMQIAGDCCEVALQLVVALRQVTATALNVAAPGDADLRRYHSNRSKQGRFSA